MKKIDVSRLKRISINGRKSKVTVDDFVDLKKAAGGGILDLVPPVLAGKKLRNLIYSISDAKAKHKEIILMFGAHVIKCGLSPIVVDLMKRGFITALATNGASMIHDFEIAYCGETSEFVEESLPKGGFGVTKETGIFVNNAAQIAAATGKGLGATLGAEINRAKLKYRHLSIFAAADAMGIQATVHVGIGTDIVYQHKECDGAAWGKASYGDFLDFTEKVAALEGGVVINFGSAVILPEVFLKAVNLARNLGHKLNSFTAANFDMIPQYRPVSNILGRPVSSGGTGFSFTGHHEFMLPLLYEGLISCKK